MYVFRNGCKWNEIPPELGSENTIYSRFKEWQSSGLYQRMWISGFLTYDELRKLVWYGK
ncbi:transposase [Candidatus Poribacteria bacterium]|nr:transposase [Candidatus Poribacteria bacterium]